MFGISWPIAAQDPPIELDPSFHEATTFQVPNVYGLTRQLAAGDLNNDGLMDIVVITGGVNLGAGDTACNAAHIYLNTGDWSPRSDGLESPISVALPNCGVPSEAVIGLLDGDIYPDIAISVHASSGTGYVAILRNSASSPGESFTLSDEFFSASYVANGITTAALDNDGDLDLVVASGIDPNHVAVVQLLENDGTADFATTPRPLEVFGQALDVIAGQFDDDTPKPDLVLSHADFSKLTRLEKVGTAFNTFTATTYDGPSVGPWTFRQLAAGRLNSDTLLEIVGTEFVSQVDDQVDVFRYDAAGNLIHVRGANNLGGDRYDTEYAVLGGVAIGHVNGSNHRDVVVGIYGGEENDAAIRVYLGNGDATLRRDDVHIFDLDAIPDSAGVVGGLVLVDLNDDGLNDVAATGSELHILINRTVQGG